MPSGSSSPMFGLPVPRCGRTTSSHPA
jgi:hypothetical protein